VLPGTHTWLLPSLLLVAAIDSPITRAAADNFQRRAIYSRPAWILPDRLCWRRVGRACTH